MTRTQLTAAFLLLLAIVSAPLFLVSQPPFQDYANHMARMFIILNQHDPVLEKFYRIDWIIIPNLAMDIIVPALAQLMPLQLAGKIFVVMIFALITGGALHLHYALHRKFSALPLLAFLFLYNAATMQGFLNYLFGCGLMLHALALWIRLADRPKKQLIFAAAAALILFFTHFFIVALFGLLLFLHENFPWRAGGFWRRNLRLVPPFIVPLLMLLLLSPTHSAPLSNFLFAPLSIKLAGIGGVMFFSYSTILNIALLLLLVNVLPLFCAREDRRRAVFYLLFAGALYLVFPRQLMGSFNADWRGVIPFAFIILAHISLPDTRRAATILTGFAMLFTGAEMAALYKQWGMAERNARDFSRIIAELPEGATLFPAIVNPDISFTPVSLAHIFCRGVEEKKLFIPSLFAAAAQQPLQIQPAYEEMRKPWLNNVGNFKVEHTSWATLNIPAISAYYDYALAMTPLPDIPAPDNWQPIGREGPFILYKINQSRLTEIFFAIAAK